VDSILIDEARTPLIISSASSDSEDFYVKFYQIAKQLKKEVDYTVDEKLKRFLNRRRDYQSGKIYWEWKIYTEKGIKYVHHWKQP